MKAYPRMRLISAQMAVVLVFVLISFRLWYWQIMVPSLSTFAQSQYQSSEIIPSVRGEILASDQFPLVTNEPAYLVYAYLPDLVEEPKLVAQKLAPILLPYETQISATFSASLYQSLISDFTLNLETKLKSSTSWVRLSKTVNESTYQQLSQLQIKGLGFEKHSVRRYPESSMAAQLVGFLGQDDFGKPKGYFGLEGFYNLELSGKPGLDLADTDLGGRPIVAGNQTTNPVVPGRSLTTHLNRSLQFLVERQLELGLARYQASAGEVIIMEPRTGAVLAFSALPAFDPQKYQQTDPVRFRHPSISEIYEPGSTFKVIVMAAALNEHLITPSSLCESPCQGPVTIGSYTIKTWNNEYHPGQTTTEILERSDNTGMVYVGSLLKENKLIEYLNQFGFGRQTGIDLEGEVAAPLRKKWVPIDLATASFGQGIAVTSIQMLAAVNAIASDGVLYQPQIVEYVQGETVHQIKSKAVGRVISSDTARAITSMMEASAFHGEAQWAALKGYRIAGKTGTAQIPIAGHYDAEKTIASFIGFAPADNPRFTMLVKLKEPQSSPWASETAAPLWFSLAKEIYRLLSI